MLRVAFFGAPCRRASVVAVCILAAASAAARGPGSLEFDRRAAQESKLERIELDRDLLPSAAAPGPVPPGEDLEHPIPIVALPFVATGSTCDFVDDHAPECTFLGGASDVVYRYRPADNECVIVELCGSNFDTALQVYEGMIEQPVACDDDGCGPSSRIDFLALEAGRTYYFVVDGWDGACGAFRLEIRACPPPCPVPNPLGAFIEPEPVCGDGYYDRTNTGCNDWPYSFTDLVCAAGELVVRGTYGTWRYGEEEFRDTDWYRVEVVRPGRVELTAQGGAETQIAILDGRLGCGEWGVACGSVLGGPCETISCAADLDPGTYWLFVATRRYVGVPCGTPYVFTVRGAACPTVSVATRSWSWVKGHYR